VAGRHIADAHAHSVDRHAVFNEARTLRDIAARVMATPLPKELIIVDDGSTDGTWYVLNELARHPEIVAVLHERNRGKGRP
jgi:dolichol-phosphate mannosyltransferase